MLTTDILHEAWIKLSQREDWNGEAHFLATAAHAMRSVIVDHARAALSQKRGGGAFHADIGDMAEILSDPSESPEDIVAMGFDGAYEGLRPSSEWRFHRDILRARDDVNVVLHCHSVYATTLACHHKTIPAFHYMTGVAGGNTIRCARYATFGTQALSDAAIEALEGRLACLLGQHGQIALGRNLEAALWLAVEVETLSRMYVQALTLGEPPILPDDEMERVIAQMKRMSYGMGPEPDGSNDVARPRTPA